MATALSAAMPPLDAKIDEPNSTSASADLAAWLWRNATLYPDKPFIVSIDQDKSVTHRQFFALCGRIGRYLKARGIGANDRVALLSNNSIEHLATYVGTMAYGATACTIHVEMNELYLGDILAGVNPKIALYEAGVGADKYAGKTPGDWMALGEWRADGATGWFAELARLPDGDFPTPVNRLSDDASVVYTSGTASKPKGVVLTFAELVGNAEPTADAFGIAATDRVLDFRSYNWVSAQVLSCLGVLCKGGTLLLARKFSQSRYLDWIATHQATIAAGNPTTINMMINRPVPLTAKDLPHLRYITSSSAPLLVEEWKRFEALYGIPIAQGYGTSETGWICGSNEKTRKFGTVGRPLPYHKLGIVGGDGKPLPTGEIGLIELGGDPARRYRYLADDGTIRINATGRTQTGDLGFLDDEGYLHITGRAKELIIRGGVNIAPVEIDNILLEMPEIAEAATIGVPDKIYGEAVVVYVAARAGVALTVDAVAAHCAKRLTEFKRPLQIVFRTALPKTERGKMDRVALVAEWKKTHAGG